MSGLGKGAAWALAGRLVLLTLLATAATLTGAALTGASRHPGSHSFEALLLAVAGWTVLGALVWLQLIVLAVGLEALSRGQLRLSGWLGTPTVLRRAVLAGCGTMLLAGGAVAGPAQAAPPTPEPTTAAATRAPIQPSAASVDPSPATTSPAGPSAEPPTTAPSAAPTIPLTLDEPLPAPERPTSGARLTSKPTRPALPQPTPSTSPQGPERLRSHQQPERVVPSPAPRADHTVLVRPGDTLWDLAAARLPLSAGLAEVASATQALFDANRDQLSDPDLIRPGQRLRLPSTGPHHPPRQEPR